MPATDHGAVAMKVDNMFWDFLHHVHDDGMMMNIIIFWACQLSMLMLHPPSHFHETATQLNNFVSKNGTHKVYVCAVFVYAGSVS